MKAVVMAYIVRFIGVAHNLKVVGSNPTPATNLARAWKQFQARFYWSKRMSVKMISLRVNL